MRRATEADAPPLGFLHDAGRGAEAAPYEEGPVWWVTGSTLTPPSVNGEPLPGFLHHRAGLAGVSFELPAPAVAPGVGDEPCVDALTVRCGRRTHRVDVSTTLPDHRLAGDPPEAGGGAEPAARPPAFNSLERVIDDHLAFAREHTDDGTLDDAPEGRGRLPAGQLLDTGDLIGRWVGSDRPDEPPRRLIVRLAERLDPVVKDLCRRPRRTLTRRRELQPVAQVSQVDAGCLRWISRQPGRTIQEKAGPRQRVLAVVRREEVDTLENRVAREVMLRCRSAARDYMKAYGEEHAGHERVERVRGFERTLRAALKESPFAGVSAPPAVVVPNYALLDEPRYAEVWSARLQLREGRRTRDHLFRWRRRLAAELGWLTLAAAVGRFGVPLYRSDAVLTDRPAVGGFLDRSTAWVGRGLGDGGTLELAPAGDAAADRPADATLTRTPGGSGRPRRLLATAAPADPAERSIGRLRFHADGHPGPEPFSLGGVPSRRVDALAEHLRGWVRA